MRQADIKSFLRKYANGNYSKEDHKRFIEWLNTAPLREIEGVTEEYRIIIENKSLSDKSYPQIVAKIEAALNRLDKSSVESKQIKTKTFTLRKAKRIWTTAAAVIIAGLFVSGYLLLNKKSSKDTEQKSVTSAVHDVHAPNSTKATIKLSNGQVIYLDSLNNGIVAMQGKVKLVKTAKTGITYKSLPGQRESDRKVEYNTLYNPRGSMVVNLTLADGTKVWLNAESSLRYPVSFSRNERKVEITGEAYFEVAKNPNKEFLVSAEGIIAQVLGTQFNINAYKEDGRTIVTLLEGAVRIQEGAVRIQEDGSSVVLKPSQQAVVTNGIHVVNDVNLEAVMAWKNGKFIMKSVGVGSIMRQISRWYDVDVTYEASIPDIKISGEVSRDLNLSQMLQVLKYSGLHVKLEDRKVVVMP